MDCVKQLKDIMVGASDDDINRVMKEVERLRDETVGKSTDEIVKAVDDYLMDEALTAKIESRNKMLNAIATKQALDFINTNFSDDYELGIEAMLVGVNDVRSRSRASVSSEQTMLQESYLGGLMADLEGLSSFHEKSFSSGVYDDDIARALWQIDNGDDFTGLAKEAVDIARVIHKWQEVSRADANDAGAWIGKLPGYITRQSHDMDKIRDAGFEKWFEDIAPKLDERTFDGVADRKAFLESVYDNLRTGIHHSDGKIGTAESLKGFRNVGRAMSKERVLHFKDADSWISYNKDYGRGEMREAVMGGLMMSARKTGLMKVLGPNAEMNYNNIVDKVRQQLKKDKASGKQIDKFDSAVKGSLDNYLAAVTGDMDIPGNKMGAQIGSALRALNSLKMLGGAVIASVTDVPVASSELRYQGASFIEAYGKGVTSAVGAIGDIGKSIFNRKLTVKTKEHRRVLAELGISLDATTGLFTHRFDPAGDLPGRLSGGMNTFFRLNGLTLWTDSIRAGASLGMANRLASYSGLSYGRLPSGVSDTLKLYGIEKAEWDVINAAGVKEVDNVGSFITPEMVRDVPDDAIKAYLSSKGLSESAYQIKKARKQVSDNLRMYYVDRSKYAVIEPDSKTKAMMLRGQPPGTVAGEFLRSIMQFKAFPITIAQKVWGREIRGRQGVGSSMKGMAELLVMTTITGYIAMTAKDLAKNRTPRELSAKSIGAAFLQGGGAGIYGDFLFGEAKTRYGGSAVSTLLGPTASQIDEIMNIWGQLREGDKDAGKSAFKFLYSNAPGIMSAYNPYASILNAWYAKAVLDNLIYYNVMESFSPGYKRRLERRMKKENEQEFLFK